MGTGRDFFDFPRKRDLCKCRSHVGYILLSVVLTRYKTITILRLLDLLPRRNAVRKILVVGAILALGLILAIQLRARSLHKQTQSAAQKEADWNGTKVFLPEANGFVTSVRGHGRACYFYIQYMNDNLTPVGGPTLLWCESETKDTSSRSSKQ